MSKEVYLYAVKINDLAIDSQCRAVFNIRKKRHAIYKNENVMWLESEDGVICKILHFTIDNNKLIVYVDGKCKLDSDWILLNKWEKVEE